MTTLKVAGICCTYKRPVQLANVIACWLSQDYPAELRELVILDDAGQYTNQAGDGWRLVSTASRFPTLGEKRNASADLASPDVKAFAVVDDDDAYLPGHLSAGVAALADNDYTIPSKVLLEKRGPKLTERGNAYLFHGAWLFRREAFEHVGRYPAEQSGQDQSLLRRFKSADMLRGDSTPGDSPATYVYRWCVVPGCYHISAMPKAVGYEKIGERKAEYVGKIEPKFEHDWRKLAEQLYAAQRKTAPGATH